MGLINIAETLASKSINAYDALRNGGPRMLYSRIRSSDRGSRSLPRLEVEWPPERYHVLRLPDEGKPRVSIVIPAAGSWRYTFNALKAVLKHSSDRQPYEVIVVDNGTSDETAEMLSNTIGLRMVRQAAREEFPVCCNEGSRLAKGEFLVFLDDRTYVQPGWLDALMKTFETKKGTSIVGARRLYCDGSIAPSSGFLEDETIVDYEEGGDFRAPEHSYLRRTDCCSPKCMMILRDQFADLGGFGDQEDGVPTPNRFWSRVKMKGKKVYLQPAARVVCFERDSRPAHFVSAPRHRTDYIQNISGGGKNVSGCSGAKHVLVVEKRMIAPDKDSGSFRMVNMLKILVDLGWEVTFAALDMRYISPYTPALQGQGIEVLYRPYTGSLKSHLMAHGRRYDIVITSRADTAGHCQSTVRRFCPGAKLVFDTVDLHFLRETRRGETEGNRLMVKMGEFRKGQELRLIKTADLTLVVSPYEKAIIERHAPGAQVSVVSNIHETSAGGLPFEDRGGVMLLGNFDHAPNVDAASFFLKEIWPLIRRKRDGLRLSIVGSNPPRWMEKLNGAGVVVTGYVKDLSGLLDSIRVSVAPLRYGSGVKGKINMSMSHGVPVVGTSVAVEGMNISNGRDAIVADDPEAFADAVIRVHENRELWESLSHRSREHVKTFFSPDVAKRQLKALLDCVEEYPLVERRKRAFATTK